ncbi:MAG: hypothetical protein ACRCUE_14735 [Bosea sp. (in: a-proteobacteria)]
MNTLNKIETDAMAEVELASHHDRGYVDLGAIVAGTVIASAITLVMSGFGAALGLSLTSVTGSGLSGMGLSVAAGLWVLWIALSSLIAGAYVTGRLRRRAGDANDQEVKVRDGAHGLVVWALSIVVGAMIAASAVSGVARTGADVVRTATTAIGSAAGSSADYAIDTLTRSDNTTGLDEPTKQQIGRIVARSFADGQLNADDRAYMSRTIAARTGLAQGEVERRIDVTTAQAKAAIEQAKVAAEKARRIGILVAFLTAAAMALGAAAAWWGANIGGRHRDENTDLSTYMRW